MNTTPSHNPYLISLSCHEYHPNTQSIHQGPPSTQLSWETSDEQPFLPQSLKHCQISLGHIFGVSLHYSPTAEQALLEREGKEWKRQRGRRTPKKQSILDPAGQCTEELTETSSMHRDCTSLHLSFLQSIIMRK